ncbi:SoxR reducing system RseC family protein [Dysgonomonas sp. OttesenSCG-928-M03]|nr:SoxR reducing system RseC family protein [Dysgonomonas sp. OttesenSCG-928-M03]
MLQNTSKIKHEGIISEISDNCVYVRIVQSSACSDCHAKNICSLSESKEKIIEIPNLFEKYHVGDKVIVTGDSSLGLKAVLYAFAIPLILIVIVLASAIKLSCPESISATLSIVSLGIYLVILYLLREKLKKKFIFSLVRKY